MKIYLNVEQCGLWKICYNWLYKVNESEWRKSLYRGNNKLIEYLRIALEDVIVFGDDYNDIEMIKYCGLGIAMENANKIVGIVLIIK